MKAGAATLNLREYTVTDVQTARAPLGLTMGWFFIRILTSIPNDKFTEFRQNGIQFHSEDMIQIGWFKMYLNESQVAYARSTGYFSLIPVKDHEKPNFKSLKKQNKLLVMATKDWQPQGSAKVVSKMSEKLFVVEDADPEELFDDPQVAKIEEVPVVKPLKKKTSKLNSVL